jgi:8-hydroxy-5-deazaflavin:NADPH oxidoreductase
LNRSDRYNAINITFIGVGNVDVSLVDRLQKLGHAVEIAARDPKSKSVQTALAHNPHFQVKSPVEAIQTANVVFLATPFAANSAWR